MGSTYEGPKDQPMDYTKKDLERKNWHAPIEHFDFQNYDSPYSYFCACCFHTVCRTPASVHLNHLVPAEMVAEEK